MNLSLEEYIKNKENPFSKFPKLKKIWIKELQIEAENSVVRFNDQKSTGKIFLIKLENDVIGITGYYYTEEKNCIGLRWHGIIPEERHKGISTKSLELLYEYLAKNEPSISYIVELAPYNEEKTIRYFEQQGYKKTSQTPKFYKNLPIVKSYEMIKNLKEA